jgi:hypothetical protein
VLKKLIATGIGVAAATGVMLLSGPANADRLSANQTIVPATHMIDGCFALPVLNRPAWCNAIYPPTTYYPSTTYYPPTTYYPGYNYGWNRWHNRYPGHFHR